MDECGEVSRDPIRWVCKDKEGNKIVVKAQLWFEARDLGAQQLNVSPTEVECEPYNES